MKDIILRMAISSLLIVVTATSCTFEIVDPPPPQEVVLKSFHNQYLVAMDDDWSLRQKPGLDSCGKFTLHHLANGKIALETCHDRYVTAPESGTDRQDWMLGQEPRLGKCGQFDLYELGNNRVAFKTCVGKFLTAGDGYWSQGLEWAIVAETDVMDNWEVFTMPQSHLSYVTNFDLCSDEGGRLMPIVPPPNELTVSYVEEERRGCVAKLEYNIVELEQDSTSWSAFLIQLLAT